jgi:hypothetical protein
MEERLFDIQMPVGPYPGSQVVKDLPEHTKNDFCQECQDVVTTYFSHVKVEHDLEIQDHSLISGSVENMKRLKLLMDSGTAQSRSDNAKKRLKKCLSDPECSSNVQDAKVNLVRSAEVIKERQADDQGQKYAYEGCYIHDNMVDYRSHMAKLWSGRTRLVCWNAAMIVHQEIVPILG